MKKNPKYLLPFLLIFSLFFLVSCLPSTYDSTKATIKGRIMVPSSPTKDITGWVHLPNAVVTLIDSEGNTHTVNTNSNGYYTIFNVAPGTNYVLTATGEVAGNTVILKDFVPQVEAGKNYDAATADCESTALALVAETLLTEGLIPEDINPEQIQNTDNFPNLVSQVCLLLEQNGDVTSNALINSQVEEVVEEILPSETPPPSSTSPNSNPYIPSSNTNLSKLDIKYIGVVVSERNIKEPIYPTFDSDTTSYILHLVGTEDDIEIIPTVEDPSASAVVLYNGGLCVYFIQVTAEDGTQNNYAIQAYFYDSIKAVLEGNSTLINEHMITVVPGTYQEGDTINFPDKAIRLQSIDPEDNIVRENTIVQGDGATYRVFSFDGLSNLGGGTNLTGFTIQNGYASDNGGGVYIGDHSSPTITYNTISENNSDTNGGGICVFDNSSPIIIHNTILGNESKNNGKGGGIAIYSDCSPSITYNIISGNIGKYGGGISIYGSSGSPPIITYNIISGNNSYNGGGIYITTNSSPDIKSNTILENECTNKGGGIYVAGTTSFPTIGGSNEEDTKNFNTICGNDANGISTDDNQVYPNDYDSIHTNNYICASCDDSPCCDHCQ